MKRKILLPILLLLITLMQTAIAQVQNKTFTISGVVDEVTDRLVRLGLRYGDLRESRICKIIDGKFSFEGEVNSPEKYMLSLKKPQQRIKYSEDLIYLFIEPGATINVKLNVKNVAASLVEGSKTDLEYRNL